MTSGTAGVVDSRVGSVTVTPLPHVATGAHRGPSAHGTPDLRAPRPDEVVAWALRLAGEVARAPFTLYRVRHVMDALAALPEQLERLVVALDDTRTVLETSLPSVESRLEDLGETFEGVDGRIQVMEGALTDFSTTITNLIGSIPGARRSLKRV